MFEVKRVGNKFVLKMTFEGLELFFGVFGEPGGCGIFGFASG